MASRKTPELNASSMADIAFLLLVFFLVTSTIEQDEGLPHRLPEILEEDIPIPPISARNVLEVLIKDNNELIVEDKVLDLNKLTEITYKHISNRGIEPHYSVSPKKAVVSLKTNRGASHKTYVYVFNALKKAYNRYRNEVALNEFNRPYIVLSEKQKKYINKQVPLVISEAEPDK